MQHLLAGLITYEVQSLYWTEGHAIYNIASICVLNNLRVTIFSPEKSVGFSCMCAQAASIVFFVFSR